MGKCIICWFGKDAYFLFNLLVMDFIDFLEYLEVSKLFILDNVIGKFCWGNLRI